MSHNIIFMTGSEWEMCSNAAPNIFTIKMDYGNL